MAFPKRGSIVAFGDIRRSILVDPIPRFHLQNLTQPWTWDTLSPNSVERSAKYVTQLLRKVLRHAHNLGKQRFLCELTLLMSYTYRHRIRKNIQKLYTSLQVAIFSSDWHGWCHVGSCCPMAEQTQRLRGVSFAFQNWWFPSHPQLNGGSVLGQPCRFANEYLDVHPHVGRQ